MSKKLGIILLFVLFAAAAITYTALQDDETPIAETSQSATPTSTPDDTATTPVDTSIPGSYIDYSEEALADAQGQKVLFFHAPWCPQCRAIEADIKSEGTPAGYTIIKVDYDSNQELRAKYGVRLQTTFVRIDENNNKIDDYVAYSEPTLDALKRDYL